MNRLLPVRKHRCSKFILAGILNILNEINVVDDEAGSTYTNVKLEAKKKIKYV